MESRKTEPRYQKLLKDAKNSRLGKIWNSYVKYYSNKGWVLTKKILWGASVGAIIFLLPLAIEATLEGEAQVQNLNSQLKNNISSTVQLRPS